MGSKTIRSIQKIFKATSGVLFGRKTAGTGRGEELTPSDVRTLLSVYSTSQVDTALTAKADLVGGVVPTAQIPAIAITEYLGSVASQAAMLLLDGDRGDWCLRSDLGTAWVLSSDDSSLLASWTQLLYPTAPVTSVAGRTGAVTLSTSDVSGLGTLATQNGTFSGASSGTNTGDQNLFSTIAVSGQSDVVADATGDTLTLVAGTNISITTNAGSDSITIANTAAGLSGTGSVDNAVLRADGTGGVTLQNSAWIINDNLTASPNNTVNHACIEATGGTTNVSVSIKPKGTGAFLLDVPDGASTGGNVRGDRATDFQRFRGSAAQVASGAISTAFGAYNVVSGDYAGCGNFNSNVSGTGSFNWARISTLSATHCGAFGESVNISAGWGFGAGTGITIDAAYSSAFGQTLRVRSIASNSQVRGLGAFSESFAEMADSSGIFAAFGDCQQSGVIFRGKTTNATPTELFLDGSSTRLTIPGQFSTSRMFHANVLIQGLKSDGSAIAAYERRVIVKCISGTATLVNSQTIGTDYEDNASTDVSITVDDATDTMQITVTGIAAETWRWSAVVDFAKLGMGT